MWGIIGTIFNSIGGTFLKYFWRKKENDRIADSVHSEIEIKNLEKVSKGLRARNSLNRLKYEQLLKSQKYKRKD
jgi:hypothetical protein|tara:strand:+ start:484 stop:705 length:222 start_codon:yes stop_codon:yes gene_type:complete